MKGTKHCGRFAMTSVIRFPYASLRLQRLFIAVLCLRVLRKMLTSQATESRCPLLKELIYLSKSAATAGKDIDYEVKVARVDADIWILKLLEENVQHDPEYAQGKYTSKLLCPSELIEMFLKRG